MKSIIHKFGDGKPLFTLVCCLHGDEIFGLRIYNYFLNNPAQFGNFKLILGNPLAAKENKRYIEEDLNRSFPGSLDGSLESQIAYQLGKELSDCDYLIDIHTTVSDVKMAPIITHLNKQTRRLINATQSKEVALIASSLKKSSMIGQVENGVSLEFNQEYATTDEAFNEAVSTIRKIALKQNNPPFRRKVFTITGVISKEVQLPAKTRNFRKIRQLGLYPFLYHAESYPTIHCLAASQLKYINA